MAESLQHKLDRVRPPRVQITYDVETGGAIQKKELPFVVGILADLYGKPAEAPPPLKERKFVEIDRDNFNDVLASIAPRLALQVDNTLSSDGGKLSVELKFQQLDDFGPLSIIQQVATAEEVVRGAPAAVGPAGEAGRQREPRRVADPGGPRQREALHGQGGDY